MRVARIVITVLFLTGCGDSDESPVAPTSAWTLSGVVREARSGAGLSGARVEIVDGVPVAPVLTGASGEFRFDSVRAGALLLRVSADGYVVSERSVTISGNTHVEFTLASAAPQEHLVFIRVINAQSGAPASGVSVTVLDGPRAGVAVSSVSDQVPVQLPTGRVMLRISAVGLQTVDYRADISGSTLIEVRAEPELFTLSGVVREVGTSRGIPNALVESLEGVNAGRGVRTDDTGTYRWQGLPRGNMRMRASREGFTSQTSDVTLTDNRELNFDLSPTTSIPSPSVHVYSGVVRDGRNNPVSGVEIRTEMGAATSDGSGRYEIRSATSSGYVLAIRPPQGYEGSEFPFRLGRLTPGTRDFRVRRIASIVTQIGNPDVFNATIHVRERLSAYFLVRFDDSLGNGTSEPDSTRMVSSNPAVLRWNFSASKGLPDGGVINGFSEVEGLVVGSAVVTGTYWGVSAPAVSVQIVP